MDRQRRISLTTVALLCIAGAGFSAFGQSIQMAAIGLGCFVAAGVILVIALIAGRKKGS